MINIGSLAGSMPAAYGSIYSATKAALKNLSISLAKEPGPKQIRVNALNPGLMVTEGLQAAGFMKGETFDKAGKGHRWDELDSRTISAGWRCFWRRMNRTGSPGS